MSAAGADLASPEPAARLLRWLEAGTTGRVPSVAIVTAHPDDEVIGAGAQLPWLPGAMIVHTTDGAPRNLRDANAAGFGCWQEYASARRDDVLRQRRFPGIASAVFVAGFW